MAGSDDLSRVELEKKNILTIINTNARSLRPKTDSLIDCFEELNVDIAIITETWLKDGPELDQLCSDLELGAGLCTLSLNRAANPTTGVAHGGVAIITRKCAGKFKPFDFPNPDNFEVLCAVGQLTGTSKKLAVVAAYVPPGYSVGRGNACMEFVEDLVVELKRKFDDLFVIYGGDFNQWPAAHAVDEFPDVTEVQLGPTRGDRCIDRLFTNMGRTIDASGTVRSLPWRLNSLRATTTLVM